MEYARGDENGLHSNGPEIRFVGGHIHVDGTLALAGFASQAEIERIFQVFILPAVFEGLTRSISKSRRARHGGMFLLPRGM